MTPTKTNNIAKFYGCVPNSETPQAVAEIKNAAAPWDAVDVPPITAWESLEAELWTWPDTPFQWWTVPGAVSLFTPSQDYRPNCAGFSLANAALCLTLNQRYDRNSEQVVEALNPMVCWQKSKGGSVWGGQSIAAMAQAGRDYGNYTAAAVGAYDPAKTFRKTTADQDADAKKHQIGFSLYEYKAGTIAPSRAVLLACRKGLACFVGNDRAVSGLTKDAHGVECAKLGGSWAHATAFCGWQNVGGLDYVFWLNSHGNVYQTSDGTPAFGCWMNENTLDEFLGGDWADVCVLTYAESPYDTTLKPTLEVR